MKPLLLTLLLVLPPAAQAEDLGKHVVFKNYLGKWTAEGDLKGTDNNTISVQEDWEGRSEGENTFVLEGKRTMNGETKPFKWTFALNPATGSCESVLTGEDGAQQLRFEVNISEVNLTLELKALSGQNGAITVKEEFESEKHDVILSHVTFTNDQGETTLQGDIKHKKVPAP